MDTRRVPEASNWRKDTQPIIVKVSSLIKTTVFTFLIAVCLIMVYMLHTYTMYDTYGVKGEASLLYYGIVTLIVGLYYGYAGFWMVLDLLMASRIMREDGLSKLEKKQLGSRSAMIGIVHLIVFAVIVLLTVYLMPNISEKHGGVDLWAVEAGFLILYVLPVLLLGSSAAVKFDNASAEFVPSLTYIPRNIK